MKKLMFVLAGAMALSFTVHAVALFSENDTWFDGGIKDGWPTTATGGGWSNTNGTTYANNKLTVSAAVDAPLTFTADVAKVTADYTAKISSTVGFTAFETLPDVPADAKAGVIVFDGNFYALAKGEGDANVWSNTTITATEEAQIDVTFLDATTVVYDINDTPVTNTVAEAATISKVCTSGDGTLADLKATAEKKQVGPSPAPGSDVKVDPVPGYENTYKVTPTGSEKTVVIQNVKAGDKLIIDPAKVDSLAGVGAGEVIVMTANETIISNTVFVGKSGDTFNAALDPEGFQTVATETGTETIPVKPQLSNAGEAIEPFVVGDDAAVGVKTIPGLYYTLVRDADVTGTFTLKVYSVQATEARTELKDTDKPTGQSFYKTQVTKEPVE